MHESIVGIDMHKAGSVVSVVGPTGSERASARFEHDGVGLAKFAAFMRSQPAPRLAVVEATRGARWMLRFLRQECGCEDVRLTDPASVNARSGVAKTDRRDAFRLASRARTGDLRYAYEATEDEHAARRVLRTRQLLVRQRTRLVNAVRALLAEERLAVAATDLTSKRGLEELEGLLPRLPQAVRSCAESCRTALKHLLPEIARLTRLAEEACKGGGTDVARRAERLAGEVPAVKELSASGIVAELGDPGRFQSGRQVACYAGLVPTTRSSDGHTYHGPAGKRGNPHLRWWLGQVAVRLLAFNDDAKEWATRHPRLHGNKRRVALARRVLVGIWASLRSGEVFDLRRALGLRQENERRPETVRSLGHLAGASG